MWRTGVFAAVVLALAGPAVAADPLPVHIGGRVASLSGGGYELGWPGVYVEARFKGPAVEVAADPAGERLAVSLDGAERTVLQASGAARVRFDRLGPGEHLIRLQKLTESQGGSAKFRGFLPEAGTVPLEPPRRSRQIEFIGDSYTVGYGDTSTKRSCTPQEIHDATDTALAFGPLTAERLGADYQVNAYSGLGVVRNYNGGRPGFSMLVAYPRLIPGDPDRLDPGSPDWRPQLIVIGLGTNDFSTPLHAGEPWKDQAELRADYRARYIGFVRELMRRQPQARFVLLGGPDFAGEVEGVAKALDPSGGRVRVLKYSGLELTGCDWHPSLGDHQRLSQALLHTIADMGDIWTGQ